MATLLLVLIYVAFISLGLPDALLGAGWPVMQSDLGVPIGFAGILQMVIAGGTITSSLFSGRILRRFGTGLTTAVSVGMTALALFGYASSPSFFWLILAAIPLGLGAGSVDAGLNSYVAAHYQSRHMSWLHSFWGLGALLGPLVLANFLSKGMPWRQGYRTIAYFQSILLVILVIALPLWAKVHGHKSKSNDRDLIHAHPSIRSLLRIRGVWSAMLTFFMYTGVEATMGLWGGSYLFNVEALSAVESATWVSVFYASITAGRFINGFATYRLSNHRLILIGEFTILIGIAMIILPFPLAATLVGFVLVGLGCAPIFPSMQHATPDHFGMEHAQDLIGLQMAAAYIGTLLLPPLFGFFAERFSLVFLPAFLGFYVVIMSISTKRLSKIDPIHVDATKR
ncbi:MFS transporter [Pleomorphochaeta sp. DL1XJH-081]|uniref:MFS transporter n=1 Tax=Pleomorphochaeta sp. DL1XJH-081 TaxID=3409690 RepID=UPI003BB7C3FD